MHAFCRQLELLHHLANALRAAGVHREHPLQVLMAEIEGFDFRQFLVHRRAACDLLCLDLFAGLSDRSHRAIEARLDIELPRRGNEQGNQTAIDQ